jgi:DNA-binding CsgD family transcriptional regulator
MLSIDEISANSVSVQINQGFAGTLLPSPPLRAERNIRMDTCMPLLQLENPPETGPSPIQGAIRRVVSLLEQREHSGVGSSTNSDAREQVLIDIELDGVRYLLIRMPQPSRVQLSPREQEIVRMVAQGHPNKVIADVLNISAWTVCTHLRRIFAKLGVGSRAAMVAQLPELGMTRKDH